MLPMQVPFSGDTLFCPRMFFLLFLAHREGHSVELLQQSLSMIVLGLDFLHQAGVVYQMLSLGLFCRSGTCSRAAVSFSRLVFEPMHPREEQGVASY